MAISKSFFGLRRGSTKSLTFSIYQGKQVTKDRIAFVKNPNTVAQRLQRMKFLATQLLLTAGLGDIIDHSWAGKKYGGESRQYFSSKALKLSGPYVPKQQQEAVPIPVQVSEGNLLPVVWTEAGDSVEVLLTNGVTLSTSVGEQFTAVGIIGGLVYVGRIIILEINTGDSGTSFVTQEDNTNFFRYDSDSKKLIVDIDFSGDVPVGLAIIRSKYVGGQWQRSTETMTINEAAEAAYYSVEAMNAAVDSWAVDSNANMLSNWYLNLSDTVYDGADVVISVATQAGGRTKIRARMVNLSGELVPYIYTTTGTAAGNCITQSGGISSVTGEQVVGAIAFVKWGSINNQSGGLEPDDPVNPMP